MQQVAVCRVRGEIAQLATVSLKVEQARGLGGPVRRAEDRARLRDPVGVQRVGNAVALVAIEIPTRLVGAGRRGGIRCWVGS